MGTPVKIRARENSCTGAGECISRQLTEEEKQRYTNTNQSKEKPPVGVLATEFIDMEVEQVKGIKINPPEKEKLLDTLGEVQGKTKAVHHTSRAFSVSATTILKWIADYGIEFDADGKVICEYEEFKELDKQMQDLAKVVDDSKPKADGDIELEDIEVGVKAKDEEKTNTITITGQESTKLRSKVGYAEHDIGNATIIYDFRADLVKVVTPNDNEMTSEVARAVALDILDIFDHE
jgi:hypothetical protein